jgi:hypothetical protein
MTVSILEFGANQPTYPVIARFIRAIQPFPVRARLPIALLALTSPSSSAKRRAQLDAGWIAAYGPAKDF